MLILHPRTVRFGTMAIEQVVAVTLDRTAARDAVEWTDHGPHPTFADVPAVRTTVTLRQQLHREDLAPAASETTPLRPGTQAALTIVTAPAASDQSRRKLTATAVLLSAETQLKGGEASPAATRTLTFVLISSDGAAEPCTITDAGAEP